MPGNSRLDSLIDMMSAKATDDVLRKTVSKQISTIARNFPENSVYIIEKLETHVINSVSLSTQRIIASCLSTIIGLAGIEGDKAVAEKYREGL